MSPPEVSVIIPARNAAATLPDTLDGLRAQRFQGSFEVVLVDDRSTDATARIAERSEVVNQVVQSAGGAGAARNAGAAVATAPKLAFLDADCRPTTGWLQAGSDALDMAELVLGETRPRPDRSHGPFDRTLWVIGCSPLFESANLFVRRALFEELGGFERWLGPRDGKELGEDVWFGWRARRAGARIAACSEALAHHEVYPRGAAAFTAERLRLRFFPALARRIPELRRELFCSRLFLSPRAAAFDVAVAGIVTARLTRWRLPAVAAIPYAHILYRDARGPGGAATAAARAAADAVGLVALLSGSVRHHSLLL